MKRIIYILFCFCFLQVNAQKISESEAIDNVMKFLSDSNVAFSKNRSKSAKPILRYSSDRVYAFDVNGSYILAGGYRSMPPILGYSDGSSYDEASRNPLFRAFVKSYEQQYRADFRIFKPTNVADVITPLCSDSWHQYTPFNNLTPMTKDGDAHCVVGCVALAMSEVMYYYKHPLKGTGYIEYNDSSGSGQILSTDLSDHSYNWDDMLDNYDGSYTDSQAKAVSQLIYDCGVSVDMRYDPDASGAMSVKQPVSLVNYFGYDESMQMYYRNFYNQAEWDSIMFNELNERRPIIVSGYTASGGHSFVCDGYDANGLFHIRFGWPGEEANGYYYFSWLTPDLPEWHDVNNPEGGLNILQSILVGIKPKLSQSELSLQHYMYGFSYINTLDGLRKDTAKGLSTDICVYSLSNCGWNRHEGTVGIALKDINSDKMSSKEDTQLLYRYNRVFSLEEFTDSVYDDTISITIGKNVSPGKYKIVPVYEENGSYVEARTMVGKANYLVCEVSGDDVSIYEPKESNSDLVVSDVDYPSMVYQKTSPPYSFSITNKGAEYSGRLYISLYHGLAPTKNLVFSMVGINIGPGETQKYEFKQAYIGIAPGTLYHLRIMSDVSLLNDSITVLYDDSLNNIEIRRQPTDIQNIDTSNCMNENVRYYDLQGRIIHNPSSLKDGTIYIEALPTGETRKRILL